MTGRARRGGRQIDIPDGDSVLNELYSGTEPEPAEPAETPPPADTHVSNTPPTPGGRRSAAPRTRTAQPAEPGTPRPAAGSTRTPAGKTRHTIYVDAAVAAELDATAEAIRSELHGLVPKHQVLAALLTAGIGQAAAVGEQLRAELLAGLRSTP